MKVRSRCSFKTWFQPVRNKLFSSSCGSDKRECDCFSRVCSLCMGCHSCCCCCCCHYCCCGFLPPHLVAQTTLQFPGPRETWFLGLFCLCGSLTARTLKTTSTLSRCFFCKHFGLYFYMKMFHVNNSSQDLVAPLQYRCNSKNTKSKDSFSSSFNLAPVSVLSSGADVVGWFTFSINTIFLSHFFESVSSLFIIK